MKNDTGAAIIFFLTFSNHYNAIKINLYVQLCEMTKYMYYSNIPFNFLLI